MEDWSHAIQQPPDPKTPEERKAQKVLAKALHKQKREKCLVSALGIRNSSQLFAPKFFLTFDSDRNTREVLEAVCQEVQNLVAEVFSVSPEDVTIVPGVGGAEAAAADQDREARAQLLPRIPEAERSLIYDAFPFVSPIDSQFMLAVKFNISNFALFGKVRTRRREFWTRSLTGQMKR